MPDFLKWISFCSLYLEADDCDYAVEKLRMRRVGEKRYRSPGLVDLQVNGFAGVDYGSEFTPEQMRRSLTAQLADGVTRMLPTIITAAPERMAQAVARLAKVRGELGHLGAMMAGLHIEGPFISAEDGPRGAHPGSAVRAPDLEEVQRWQESSGGLVKMVTLAPEWPGACRFIEQLVQQGIVVAIGHTAANAAQIHDAVTAGATMATHLGNATFPAPPKFNPLWDQLADDRLAASVIADGFHVPASFLKTALRTKNVDRLVLVTDAASPAGAAPGRYQLGEVEVELHPNGRVTLAGSTRLAGSALRMNQAVGNMVRLGGATLEEAVQMATVNAARLGQVEYHAGDEIEFLWEGQELAVQRVWLAGKEAVTAL
jgi:N-acetylglucosamine-6-phosphate deacetylase